MQNHEAKSFKQLTISVEKLPASMAQQAKLNEYAAERARLLLGCYRTGDANDPETYVAAITATLAHFPEEVVTQVTHPVTGIVKDKSWLPTVKEVRDACELAVEPIVQRHLREKRIAEQMAARKAQDDAPKPTLAELKEKYGENWGLDAAGTTKTAEVKAEENRAAREREIARVAREYAEICMKPPSKLALSPTALRIIAEQNELREQIKSRDETRPPEQGEG